MKKAMVKQGIPLFVCAALLMTQVGLPAYGSGVTETEQAALLEQCSCKTLCTEGLVNTNCPVCAVAEEYPPALCTGTAPENPPAKRAPEDGIPLPQPSTEQRTVETGTASVLYIDGNGEEQTVTATKITADTGELTDGWYYVSGEVTRDGGIIVKTKGEGANIILADGCALTVTGQDGSAGIHVLGDNSITIYGQSGGTGTLTAKGGGQSAGIGSGLRQSWGNITINGGAVTANGAGDAAGIGGGNCWGGSGLSAGCVTINGGIVTANGTKNTADIGGGYCGSSGTVTITGGIVVANSGYCGIGPGLDYVNAPGTFSTTENGNAFIVASSIFDYAEEQKALWSGVIFDGDRGAIYGTPTLESSVEIPAGRTLFVTEGKSLFLASDATVVNKGVVYVTGTLAPTDNVWKNEGIGWVYECAADAVSGLTDAQYTKYSTTENVPCGNLVVSGGLPGTDYNYLGSRTLEILTSTPLTIANQDPSSPALDKIAVAEGVAAGLTLSGVHIDVSAQGQVALALRKNATASLTLSGENVLKGNGRNSGIRGTDTAGVAINGTGSLNTSGINAGSVTLSGGVVVTPSIDGTFTTTEAGTAFIVADSISDQSDRENWSGVICAGNVGGFYKVDHLELQHDIQFSENLFFTIGSGKELVLSDDVTLANKGTVQVLGALTVNQSATWRNVEPGTVWAFHGSFITGEVAHTEVPEHELPESNLTVSGGSISADYAYDRTRGELSILSDTPLTIGMKSGVTQTSKDKIVVDGNTAPDLVFITLNGVDINWSGTESACAFELRNGADVDLTLSGSNTLWSGWLKAGLQVPRWTSLTIRAAESGGALTAVSAKYGAGIGGENEGDGGTVIISGGTVTAIGGYDTPGIGGGYVAQTGSAFSTGTNGNAFIVSNTDIKDTTGDRTDWSGVIFEGGSGKVYGDSITLQTDGEIPAGKTLTIDQGQTLTIAAGTSLTNRGTIQVDGTLINHGTIRNYGRLTGTAIQGGGVVMSPSQTSVTFAIRQADDSYGESTQTATYGDTVKITATIEKKPADNTRRAVDENTVDFWLNRIGEGGTKLNETPIQVTRVGDTLTATLDVTLVESIWHTDKTYAIHADFSGYGDGELHLTDSAGWASLSVAKVKQPAAKVAVSATSLIYDGSETTVTITPITTEEGAAVTYSLVTDKNSNTPIDEALATLEGTGIRIYRDGVFYVKADVTETAHYAAAAIYSDEIVISLRDFDFVVEGGTLGEEYTYVDKTLTVRTDAPLTIKNKNPEIATSDKIVVRDGVSASLTLDNVYIDMSRTLRACALDLQGNAELDLTLSGTNSLASGSTRAGLHVPEGATLTIRGSENGGALKASGKDGGAGIGGNDEGASGTITILSGVVEARGTLSSAAIGGGAAGAGGTITISGGTVIADSSLWGFDIGSGSDALSGSTFSTGKDGNAFIVTEKIEDYSNQARWGGVIFVSGSGKIYGTPTLNTDAELPVDGTLVIEAQKQLTISAGVAFVNHSEININEGGAFTNRGNTENRGQVYVHGGFSNQGDWVNLSTGMVYECVPDVLLNKGLAPGQYVALGSPSPIGDLVVSGGTIFQDFRYDKENRVLTITGDGLTVGMRPGVTTTADGIVVVGNGPVVDSLAVRSNGADAPTQFTLNGVNIDRSGAKWNAYAFAVKYGTEVELTLVGDNELTGGNRGAGLEVSDASAITIGGTGSLTANGGRLAAGIGGGGGNGGTVTITGGTVTANGGEEAAGIGGGYEGNGGTVTITGGTVTAIGRDGAAGIGGSTSAGGSIFSTGEGGTAVIFASSIEDSEDTSGWSGVIFMGGSGQFYALKSATLEGDLTIPEGNTLTIARGETLTVNSGMTLTNHGRIINGGTIRNYGIIAPNAPEGGMVSNSSHVTLSFALKGAEGTPIYEAEYGKTILITATARRAVPFSLRAAIPGTADFYLGSVERGIKLNEEPVLLSGQDGVYTATLEVALSSGRWVDGANTVTVDFGGMASLLESQGIGFLAVTSLLPPPGGGGGGTPTPPPITVTKPDPGRPEAPTNVETELDGKTNRDGDATVRIPDNTITDAIDAASKQMGQSGISVTANIRLTQTANSLTVILSEASLDHLIAAHVTELTITSDLIRYSLNLEALREIRKSVTDDLTITVKRLSEDALSQEARSAIGSRPAFDLTMTSGAAAIVDLGEGRASVWLPYTPGADEIPSYVRAVYVDGDGKAAYLPDSRYHASAKALFLSTDHFSLYGIGYDMGAWLNPFADVPNHAWYLAPVRFVVMNNLFSGTSATTFSPEDSMTRAMLWTVLARGSGQDMTGGDTWYANAVRWVSAEGISDGTDPHGNMTREQLSVMLYRFSGSEKTVADLSAYHDRADISGWASDAMQWAVVHRIVLGKEGGLAPKDTLSRAEAAAMLSRMESLLVRYAGE